MTDESIFRTPGVKEIQITGQNYNRNWALYRSAPSGRKIEIGETIAPWEVVTLAVVVGPFATVTPVSGPAAAALAHRAGIYAACPN